MELLLGQKIKLSFGSARTKAWDGEMANNVMRAQNARRQGDRKGAGGRAGGRTMLLGKVLNARALSPQSAAPFSRVLLSGANGRRTRSKGAILLFAPIAFLIDKVSPLWCHVQCCRRTSH